jgi:hypothetical protein
MLDLAKPLDRIGSFIVHDSGEVTLGNHPLTKEIARLENEGIPPAIGTTTAPRNVSGACRSITPLTHQALLDYLWVKPDRSSEREESSAPVAHKNATTEREGTHLEAATA